LEALTDATREAVIDLLYRLADDELIMSRQNLEWTGPGPILEEGIAFSSMAQDEMGHAQAFYAMLHELGEPDPDALAFTRSRRQLRCASLVSLPDDRDWGFCALRQFLYDAAEMVRLTALSESSLTPLARLAAKLRSEEEHHLMNGRRWVLRLAGATDESHKRMQTVLNMAYSHALGLFEPTEADEPLAQAEVCPHEEELRRQWESAVAPVLAEAGLELPEAVQPIYGGRVGQHPEALTKLLADLRLVHNFDRSAKR
jgi:ring-1,2-phenylacetyl-CoA epoxidase subunit PaaC